MRLSEKLGYTYDDLVAEGKKYRSKTEFLEKDGLLFRAAKRCGALAEVFGTKHKRWSEEALRKLAVQFKNTREMQKHYPGALSHIRRAGLVEELFPNKRKKWTKENILLEAEKYSGISEMKAGCESAYNAAKRLGIHLFEPKQIRWTEDLLFAEASKYTNLRELYDATQSAYAYARRNNLIDKLGLVKKKGTLDFSKPAFIYVVNTTLTNGKDAIMFGLTTRQFKERYPAVDRALMRDCTGYWFYSAEEAANVERCMINDFLDFKVALGESPFSEKTGSSGEIVYAEAGRDKVESWPAWNNYLKAFDW